MKILFTSPNTTLRVKILTGCYHITCINILQIFAGSKIKTNIVRLDFFTLSISAMSNSIICGLLFRVPQFAESSLTNWLFPRFAPFLPNIPTVPALSKFRHPYLRRSFERLNFE